MALASPDAGALDDDQLAFFRTLLVREMRSLLESAGQTVDGMSDGSLEFPDPTDRATLECDRNFDLRIRDRERKLIKKIREALVRIEDGTFGWCEECGERISSERLRARPVATLCIKCKESQEAGEKRSRGW